MRGTGLHEYALCDHKDEYEQQCAAYVLPSPKLRPGSPYTVLVHYLDVTLAMEKAGWVQRDGKEFCPEHIPAGAVPVRAAPPGPGEPGYLDNPKAAGAPEGSRWGYLPCGCANDGHGRHVGYRTAAPAAGED